MAYRWTWSLLAITALLAGCANDDKTAVHGVSSDDANRLDAAGSNASYVNRPTPAPTAETHFAAGQLAETQNAPDRAIQQYKQALKLDPKHLNSIYRLAICYAQIKDYPLAIDFWQKYIRATDGAAQAWSNLGFCYELAGRIPDAEQAYQRGIAKDPKSEPCRVNYGLMLARNQRVDEALVQLRAVLPEAQVHYNLASIYKMQGRTDLARSEYRAALATDPKLDDAQAQLDLMK